MRTLTLLPVLAIAALVFAPACEEDVAGSCERIAEACHDLDEGEGAAHDCHELAETEGITDEECSLEEDSCLEACDHH